MRQLIEQFNGDEVTIEPQEKGTFRFSPFANSFHFHLDDGIEEIKEFALSYLSQNYPDKAPFRLTRVETKQPEPGATGVNRYVSDSEVYVCFEPLLNTDWD